MSKILVSSCLLGEKVRYDAKIVTYDKRLLLLAEAGLCIPVCPEVAGGLSVPRPPAEIRGGEGSDVLQGKATVIRKEGTDVTDAFVKGARSALELVKEYRIPVAILKSKSPSCGKNRIYDGSFSGTLKKGEGVTVALLKEHGVHIFDETEVDEAIAAYVNSGFKLPEDLFFDSFK